MRRCLLGYGTKITIGAKRIFEEAEELLPFDR